jgi:hypothetical protein
MTPFAQIIVGISLAAVTIVIVGLVAGALAALVVNRLERRRERHLADFVRRHPWAGPSRPTLDSELNKDRSGKEGREAS